MMKLGEDGWLMKEGTFICDGSVAAVIFFLPNRLAWINEIWSMSNGVKYRLGNGFGRQEAGFSFLSRRTGR